MTENQVPNQIILCFLQTDLYVEGMMELCREENIKGRFFAF